MNASRLPLGLVPLLSLAALPLYAAEEGAEQTTLGRIVVEEAAGESTTEGTNSYAAGPSATATGLDLSLRETPQSVAVITRQHMDDRGATTITQALQGTIGISIKAVDRGRNSLSARGFDINNFQLDGLPVSSGNIGLETTSNAIYDRIEVVRGATGLLSGAGDPSAAINLVRKHADSREFSLGVSGELASWQHRAGTLDLSTPLNGAATVRARVVASLGEQDAFVDLEHSRHGLLYAIVDAELGQRTFVSIGGSLQQDERRGVLWAGLPLWYTDGTRTELGRSFTTATRWNRWDTVEHNAFVNLTQVLAGGWALRATANYHYQDEDSMLLWMWGDPDAATGEGMEASPYHYLARPKQLSFALSLTGPFSLFGREHQLTIGAMRSRWRGGWENADPVDTLPPVGDIRRWDGSYPEPAMTDFYVGSYGETIEAAAYLATHLQLADRLKLVAGGRISSWKHREDAAAWTSEPYTVDGITEFTPYAGLVFDFNTWLSGYASYTDAFKPQTARDRDGRYLEPLVGRSYELGVKGEFAQGRLNTMAAVFRTDQDNYAVPDTGYLVPGTTDQAMRGAQGVKAEGYELEAVGRLTDRWNLSAGWTQFTARDAEDRDVAVDHPRQQLRVFSTYAVSPAFTVGGGVSFEGKRPATAANPGTGLDERIAGGSYTLAEAMARYAFNDRWHAQLNATNLFDQRYRVTSWWGSPFTWGEPRRVSLTVGGKF